MRCPIYWREVDRSRGTKSQKLQDTLPYYLICNAKIVKNTVKNNKFTIFNHIFNIYGIYK